MRNCHFKFWLPLLLVLAAGCNLTLDVDAYPYDGADAGADTATDSADGSTDPVGPRLLMTEFMLRPQGRADDGQRSGQYIEIYNAGDEAIDPRQLVIEVQETNERILIDVDGDDSDAADAADAVAPIAPGEFFVFIRRDDPTYEITAELADDRYFEYGRWGDDVELSATRQTIRLLEMRGEFEFRIHHQAGWRQGRLVDLSEKSSTTVAIAESVGLGLLSDIDDVEDAADPDNWCLHIERFGQGPLYGSPGQPSPSRCL